MSFSSNLTKISFNKFKVCDITSLPAKYECPRSGLCFYDVSTYEYIMNMDASERERYYEINRYKREYKGKY